MVSKNSSQFVAAGRDRTVGCEMSRERRWWGVPRSFAGFSLWRISNPFDLGESEAVETRTAEDSKDTLEEKDSLQKVEEDHRVINNPFTKRIERSRSRSSSLSFKSRKSMERSTPEVETVETKINALPDISFTFLSEQDRDNEFIVVDPSIKSSSSSKESSLSPSESTKKSEITCDLKRMFSTEDCSNERSSSEEDARVRRIDETSEGNTDVKHVSSLVVTMKPVDYSNLKIAVENVVKEHEYEVLKDPPYATPLAECFPVYATIDKSNQNTKGSTLDSSSSKEFQEALPFSINKSSTIDSTSSKDFSEALPSVPPPDWDSESVHSEYNADYAELTTPEPVSPKEEQPPDVQELKEGMEYCQHRAELKPSMRRVTLLRCKKTVKRTPSIGKVRNKLGKAWKKVRGWWIEERVRLNEVILKRDSVREPSVVSDVQDFKSMSEEDVYVGLHSLVGNEDSVKSVEDVRSACSTLPARYLRRKHRGRSPTPALSRSSSIAAFRRSKFFPEVNKLD